LGSDNRSGENDTDEQWDVRGKTDGGGPPDNRRPCDMKHSLVTQESPEPDVTGLVAAEDRHFWFRARNDVIGMLVKQVISNLPSGYHVLEVGCGTGNVLRVLETTCTRGTAVGLELSWERLRFARRRVTGPLVQGDLHHPPFKTPFDLIGLFDVLEHLPEDVQALKDLSALLAPQGVLLLSVPAHPRLWSYFDEASSHYRRYTLDNLGHALTSAGYRIEYLTQYMASLFPLMWISRKLTVLRRTSTTTRNFEKAWRLAQQDLTVIPALNEVLSFLLRMEVPLLARRYRLPIGTSLLAVAQKE
jgi:SAM-dependent methyltransferase